ncbi:MAG: response regulator [Deltaproteobacteria bacterium]|nr:response regulator [Deltaproteobacteria bacterium]
MDIKAQHPTSNIQHPISRRERPKILIVDDRVENLIAMERLLSDLNVEFVRAGSGNEALIKSLENDFAIALMDVQMPEMDGFETVELMRQDKKTMHLPVIFVSAVYKDDYHQIRGIETGAVDFITKPIIPKILRGKVNVFLDLYRNRMVMEEEIRARKQSEAALKASETELTRLNEHLEKRVRERTRELIASQAQLIQAEKLSALGTVTAGIAHELNNPMMGILNYIQYCIGKTSEDDRRYAILQDAEREIKRCADIINNLLTFSRFENQGKDKYQREHLATILDRVVELLLFRIKAENVSLSIDVTEETPEIMINVGAVQQVLLNLIGNALDAVREKGNREIRIAVRSDGKFVRMTVADNGSGIPAKHLIKIFDPFFTTKPVGKGTGLGLSVSQSIIKAHGGKMTCESEVGEGTRFTVVLPIEMKSDE